MNMMESSASGNRARDKAHHGPNLLEIQLPRRDLEGEHIDHRAVIAGDGASQGTRGAV
jgi:hypothetical protein